jgi:hypothetical protein
VPLAVDSRVQDRRLQAKSLAYSRFRQGSAKCRSSSDTAVWTGVPPGELVDADRMFSDDPFTCTPRFNPLVRPGMHISRSLTSSRQRQVSFPALGWHCICISVTWQACSTASAKAMEAYDGSWRQTASAGLQAAMAAAANGKAFAIRGCDFEPLRPTIARP